jgi:hypothetical protein
VNSIILTFLIGFIWLVPYVNTAMATYYQKLVEAQ